MTLVPLSKDVLVSRGKKFVLAVGAGGQVVARQPVAREVSGFHLLYLKHLRACSPTNKRKGGLATSALPVLNTSSSL